MDKMTTGEKIKYYRIRREMTQGELSEATGIPLGTIKKYETDNRIPRKPIIQKIATALEIKEIYLIDLPFDFDEKDILNDIENLIKENQKLREENAMLRKIVGNSKAI